MGVWLSPIFFILNQLVSLYILVIFITVIMSWLLAFGVLNRRNPVVAGIDDLCNRLTEPLLRPLRRLLPPIGGLDLSPLILLLIIYAVQMYLGIIESQLLRL